MINIKIDYIINKIQTSIFCICRRRSKEFFPHFNLSKWKKLYLLVVVDGKTCAYTYVYKWKGICYNLFKFVNKNIM